VALTQAREYALARAYLERKQAEGRTWKHIDGNYTAAQVQAALAYVKGDPTLQQYTNVEGVLEDYLASLPAPAAETGGLMFTGGSTAVIFAFGLALMGGGLFLRKRLV
jgi:hypothetical protein